MGRDFSIGHVESTFKPTSFIMYKILKDVCSFEDERENGIVYIEDLAKIITSLKFIMDTVESPNAEKDNIKFFMENMSFYESDEFAETLKNCKDAYNLFIDCLVKSVISENKEIQWNYS